MKRYDKPQTMPVELTEREMIAGAATGGVVTGGTLGDSYSKSDATYTRHHGFGTGLWEDMQ